MRVLIGGAPYRAYVLQNLPNVPPGITILRLLENVGDRDIITNEEATTFFAAGTLLKARREGEYFVLSYS